MCKHEVKELLHSFEKKALQCYHKQYPLETEQIFRQILAKKVKFSTSAEKN